MFRCFLRPLFAVLVLMLSATAHASDAPRIATVDWTLTETLLALGVTPVGVAETDGYRRWVEAPALPPEVIDIGLRSQPNRELLAGLNLDFILISPLYGALEPVVSQIGPVESMTMYGPGGDLWQRMQDITLRLGRRVGRGTQARTLLAGLDHRLDQLRNAFDRTQQRPLLVVQLIDDRHVRVYGDNSLFDMVLQRLGIANAWPGQTNHWGFANVGVEALATVNEAQLVVVEPVPQGAAEALSDSPVWRRLPAVQAHGVLTLPAVWSFGGPSSAARFADLLANALLEEDQ
ncbi:ABC transporter substrate-binding protein [Marinobacter bohaiensis]|uniref:ABC transporter substrate-binding protein n=1 Tax=Marinobacter bohaiensis TaxID=2201898 RepID=UPI000DACCDA0|nr:ABC transporter substrate-binding protein [Marinobacter bohaiensis]